jgi:predicted transport protein
MFYNNIYHLYISNIRESVYLSAVFVKKQWLIIQLRVDESNFEDPLNLTKDISHRGWSVTRELKVGKDTKVDDIMHLFRQAYEYQQ